MDGGWKQLIEDYLEEFFRFFFPAVHAGIDFRQDYQYLDKELAQIMVGSESGRREVDKLIQVHWLSGGSDLILLHVEVQAQREADFAERMCVYNCRIWDRYNRPVVSLALLVDGDPQFRPDRFRRQRAGCRLEFVFPIVKLLDFKSEEELAVDPSPFAIASLIQLRKLQAGKNVQRRYAFKLALVHELYRRGYQRGDVLKLFRFMDYLLRLPAGLIPTLPRRIGDHRRGVEDALRNQCGANCSSRRGRQEGKILQGAVDLLRHALEVRFGEVPHRCSQSSSSARMWKYCELSSSRYSRSDRWTNCSSERVSSSVIFRQFFLQLAKPIRGDSPRPKNSIGDVYRDASPRHPDQDVDDRRLLVKQAT